MNKKIYIFLLILVLILFSSCTKRNVYFTDSELEKFGLNNLQEPYNSSNFYNKSSEGMLFCYMTVSKDDDVRNFVLNALNMFENDDMYKVYGYAKNDDMYNRQRNIYLSKNINDYLINSNNYSEDDVTFNSYRIYYSLSDKSENTMFILGVTSYTKNNTNYLTGYNLIISVVKRSSFNYNIITE